jgi:hypothetical protein
MRFVELLFYHMAVKARYFGYGWHAESRRFEISSHCVDGYLLACLLWHVLSSEPTISDLSADHRDGSTGDASSSHVPKGWRKWGQPHMPVDPLCKLCRRQGNLSCGMATRTCPFWTGGAPWTAGIPHEHCFKTGTSPRALRALVRQVTRLRALYHEMVRLAERGPLLPAAQQVSQEDRGRAGLQAAPVGPRRGHEDAGLVVPRQP